jgi:hypothetical protein
MNTTEEGLRDELGKLSKSGLLYQPTGDIIPLDLDFLGLTALNAVADGDDVVEYLPPSAMNIFN